MSTVTDPARAAREQLSGFQGRLIGRDDAEYGDAGPVYNAMIHKSPALIAQCATPGDVAAVVGFAREHELPLAVRGGGHNGAGLGTVDDGVVIDLSPMRGVEVDPEARTVRVDGGCTWGEVDRATNEHGLATPSGIISTTGVGGLTLGGGLGHLTRKCGLTIDNLVEAELVLAREANNRGDVGGGRALRDQRRRFVDHRVVDRARLAVVGVVAADQPSLEPGELLACGPCGIGHCAHVVLLVVVISPLAPTLKPAGSPVMTQTDPLSFPAPSAPENATDQI